jgi:hypothetical protein
MIPALLSNWIVASERLPFGIPNLNIMASFCLFNISDTKKLSSTVKIYYTKNN